MGAAKQLKSERMAKTPRKSKNHRLEACDFDNNPELRRNLLQIIEEEARVLQPHEVAWFLGRSLSDVYLKIRRIHPDPPVRYCPKAIKELKRGIQAPLERSVTIEKKSKSVGLPSISPKKGRKVKATLCL